MIEKWKISATNSAAIENEAGEIVADCLGGLCTAKNSGAHARFIAAAPDLLEALEEAQLQIEYLSAKFPATGSGEAVLAKIRAALKKAKP